MIAIDDEALCVRVLERVADAEIFRACLAGQCGRAARRWANLRCDDVLKRVDEEIDAIAFDFDPKGFMGIHVRSDTLRDWTEEDRGAA